MANPSCCLHLEILELGLKFETCTNLKRVGKKGSIQGWVGGFWGEGVLDPPADSRGTRPEGYRRASSLMDIS